VRLVSPDFASSRETRQGVAAAGQHDRPLNTNLWVCKHDAKDEVPGGLSATLPQSGRIRVRRDGRGTENHLISQALRDRRDGCSILPLLEEEGI
jgi:hypothetical protein